MTSAPDRAGRRPGRGKLARDPRLVALLLAAAALLLSGCKEVAEASLSSGYEPAHVEEGSDAEAPTVTFTEIGARRVGLETATATQQDEHTAVPYAALIYDGQGVPWVYTVPEERTYQRVQVVVDHIDGDTALLADGVDPGSDVVTVGATEVYGSELGMDGGH